MPPDRDILGPEDTGESAGLAEVRAADSDKARQTRIRDAIGTVAVRLGHPPAICRECHLHPGVTEGCLADELKPDMRLLKRRLTR
ncbi:MAG: hypothetical protein ACK41U_08570 [Paracoccus sp. (in: a-proteobacteria)]|uniref:hypothetical protein n=1 Tax=Paracoccus sp. TaxID=267 RepID=UPI00391D838B